MHADLLHGILIPGSRHQATGITNGRLLVRCWVFVRVCTRLGQPLPVCSHNDCDVIYAWDSRSKMNNYNTVTLAPKVISFTCSRSRGTTATGKLCISLHIYKR